jgi:hypothetical protein
VEALPAEGKPSGRTMSSMFKMASLASGGAIEIE